MGTNKALLEVGGAAMLRRTAGLLEPLVDDLFIVANDPEPYVDLGLPVFPDLHPGNGAAGGIETALARAAHPLVLCVACDMPHIAGPLLELLLDAAGPEYDALLPRVGGYPEPLLAVYGRSALPGFERAIAAGRRRVIAGLDGLRVRFLEERELVTADPALRSFVNVNTPHELSAARTLAAGGTQ
jgi:molybdopterin-guanine dinucleotide biosynthesis protein A